MKLRHLSAILIAALAVALGLQAQEKEPKTALGEKMEKIASAFRKARGQIADKEKNADTLAQLATIRENMTAALKDEPAAKSSVPAADQAKFVADYQARMKKEIANVEAIEAALKAGNNEEAGKLAGDLNTSYKDAHKQFKKASPKKN